MAFAAPRTPKQGAGSSSINKSTTTSTYTTPHTNNTNRHTTLTPLSFSAGTHSIVNDRYQQSGNSSTIVSYRPEYHSNTHTEQVTGGSRRTTRRHGGGGGHSAAYQRVLNDFNRGKKGNPSSSSLSASTTASRQGTARGRLIHDDSMLTSYSYSARGRPVGQGSFTSDASFSWGAGGGGGRVHTPGSTISYRTTTPQQTVKVTHAHGSTTPLAWGTGGHGHPVTTMNNQNGASASYIRSGSADSLRSGQWTATRGRGAKGRSGVRSRSSMSASSLSMSQQKRRKQKKNGGDDEGATDYSRDLRKKYNVGRSPAFSRAGHWAREFDNILRNEEQEGGRRRFLLDNDKKIQLDRYAVNTAAGVENVTRNTTRRSGSRRTASASPGSVTSYSTTNGTHYQQQPSSTAGVQTSVDENGYRVTTRVISNGGISGSSVSENIYYRSGSSSYTTVVPSHSSTLTTTTAYPAAAVATSTYSNAKPLTTATSTTATEDGRDEHGNRVTYTVIHDGTTTATSSATYGNTNTTPYTYTSTGTTSGGSTVTAPYTYKPATDTDDKGIVNL